MSREWCSQRVSWFVASTHYITQSAPISAKLLSLYDIRWCLYPRKKYTLSNKMKRWKYRRDCWNAWRTIPKTCYRPLAFSLPEKISIPISLIRKKFPRLLAGKSREENERMTKRSWANANLAMTCSFHENTLAKKLGETSTFLSFTFHFPDVKISQHVWFPFIL